MQGLILGGIAAAICWVAWRRHNHLLDKQAAESGRALKPAPVCDFACFACAADVYFNVSYVLRVVRSADSGVYDGAVSRR